MKRIRAIAVVPTLFTLGNLVCGFFAIVVASRIARPTEETLQSLATRPTSLDSLRQLFSDQHDTHNLMLCGALILIAMVFDALDGQVARMTRAMSDFGAQLDSLCDLVTFGVAPAILLVKMCPEFTYGHREVIWSIAALFCICAALRLARYNVETDEHDERDYFNGLPTPAAAAVIASFTILSYTLRQQIDRSSFADFYWWMQHLLPPFAVLIAVLMVSRVPYPHIVNQLLRGQRSFAHIVAIVFAAMALLVVRGYAVTVLCCLFVLVPLFRFVWSLARSRRPQKEPLF